MTAARTLHDTQTSRACMSARSSKSASASTAAASPREGAPGRYSVSLVHSKFERATAMLAYRYVGHSIHISRSHTVSYDH